VIERFKGPLNSQELSKGRKIGKVVNIMPSKAHTEVALFSFVRQATFSFLLDMIATLELESIAKFAQLQQMH
jgi:hypothetical protein